MLPPKNVCTAAPRFPITLRERTIMPRTMPKFRTIRYPGNSIAEVTIVESTRPGMRFSSLEGVYRCDSTGIDEPCATLFPLLFSS